MAVSAQHFTMESMYLEPTEESIGQRVRRLRQARGWSLDRLAGEARKEAGGSVGLSRGTIHEMETRQNRVPWDSTLRAIANALDVPVEYLRTGKMPAEEHSLSDYSPEMYGRAQGIKDPKHLHLIREQIDALIELETLKGEDEPGE